MDIRNDYWDAIQLAVRTGVLTLDDRAEIISAPPGKDVTIRDLARTYSLTVADPALVEHVAKLSMPEVAEADAGRGYWTSLMSQCNKLATAYDVRAGNFWVPVNSLNRKRTELGYHRDATLLCMSAEKPYRSLAAAIKGFKGNHLMFSAEDSPFKFKHLKAVLDGVDMDKRRIWVPIGDAPSFVCFAGRPRFIFEFARATPSWHQPTRVDLRTIGGDRNE